MDNWDIVSSERLERYSQIVQDLKKVIQYEKSSGTWYWYDRGETGDLVGPFPTFWDCVCDIVEPYAAMEYE